MAPDPAHAALDELAGVNAVARLHARDATLWSSDPEGLEVVANRLGWLDVAAGPRGWADALARFADEAHAAGVDRVLLAGMGGSSLAPEVFAKVFSGHVRGARLDVLDSTHPDAVRALLDDDDLSRTLVIVSSKSGSTEETRDFGAHAARLLPGPDRLVAVTDGGSALEEEARAAGYRSVFTNPSDIGGRYSALSYFGMVPAALLGVDVAEIWRRAGAMIDRCGPHVPVEENPAARLAAFMGGLARSGRDKLTLLAPTELAPLGDWVEQLVAESTGKRGRGIVPVVGEVIGEPAVYGDDRAFVSLHHAGEGLLGVDDLAAAGHPVMTVDVGDRLDLGAEFVRWEMATALAGVLLDVNPFDEPNVAESKANTLAVLTDVTTGGGALPDPEHGDVAALLDQLRPGDYFSVQAYLAPTAAHAEPLQRLRQVVRDRRRVATTFGWGPRFLHSTGQLHKGGPDSIVALQVVDRPGSDPTAPGPDIPGRDFDFATLVRAQAVGDLRSLRDHGRRVAQVGVERPGGLEALADAVDAATR